MEELSDEKKYADERRELMTNQMRVIQDAMEEESHSENGVFGCQQEKGISIEGNETQVKSYYEKLYRFEVAKDLGLLGKRVAIGFRKGELEKLDRKRLQKRLEYIDAITAPSTKGECVNVKTKNQENEIVVPEEFKSEDVELFFRELEKEMVIFEGKETRLLDRTSLPWVFVSKKIAAYVTHILQEDYGFYYAAALMGKVTNYKSENLRDLYRKMKASEEWPIGADVVDKALKRCYRHRLKKE